MTDKAPKQENLKQVQTLVGLVKTLVFGQIAIDPVDAKAPLGTQRRRISAYNTLRMVARPGRDDYCAVAVDGDGPCVLKRGHGQATFDDRTPHMDASQRERAYRYLVHSEPDAEKRA